MYIFPGWNIDRKASSKKPKDGSIIEFIGASDHAHLHCVNRSSTPPKPIELRLSEVAKATPPTNKLQTQAEIMTRNEWIRALIPKPKRNESSAVETSSGVGKTLQQSIRERRETLEKRKRADEEAKMTAPDSRLTISPNLSKKRNKVEESEESDNEMEEAPHRNKRARTADEPSQSPPRKAKSRPQKAHGKADSPFLNFHGTAMSGAVVMMTADMVQQGYHVSLSPPTQTPTLNTKQ